ncbi:MAG TPA: ABC transporter substrate-binding protein [Candidatus Acidoferrales bacterium]|nr:ABC transporter substrate-binding protein [Candidatus Acidoferrales bacterium]
MRISIRLLLLVAFLAGITTVAEGQENYTVKVGIINSISDAPILIADKKGYFKEEGLAVDYSTFDSAASMVAPLGAGQLDVAAGGTSAGLFNAVARGIDMRVVADKASDPHGYGFAPLLVRTDLVESGKYKSLKDLKGMTVAISAKGSSSWPELDAITRKAGLKFDDVKNISLDYPDHVIGLKNKSIDASVTIEPFATAAVESGAAKRIMGNDEYYLNQEVAVLIYGGQFIRNHHDAALKFMKAYIRGVRYYNDALKNGKLAGRTSDDVIAILAGSTKMKDPSLYRKIVPNGVDPNGKVNVASMDQDIAFYRSEGLLQGNVTASQTVDTTFATEAVKALGPYRPNK